MRYNFKASDLYISAKFLCVGSTVPTAYTVGEIYEVIDIADMSFPYEISSNHGYFVFELYEFNKVDQPVQFYPITNMTEKDLFIFRLSGKLPYEI